MKTRRISASSIAILLCGTAMPALAQDETADGGLDEIVVTAERREQNLQDVPVSATVLSGEQLAQREPEQCGQAYVAEAHPGRVDEPQQPVDRAGDHQPESRP